MSENNNLDTLKLHKFYDVLTHFQVYKLYHV